MERFRDTSEGVEDMVLLNGSDKKEEKESNKDSSKIMEDELDAFGIRHGEIQLVDGLFYDLQEDDDVYRLFQFSVRYKLARRELMNVKKDSTIGKLYNLFGFHFKMDITLSDDACFYFNSGNITYYIDNAVLFVNPDGTISNQPKDNEVANLKENEYIEYNSECRCKKLNKLLEGVVTKTREQFNAPSNNIQKGKNIFRNKIYDVYFNFFDELIIEEVICDNGGYQRNKVVACCKEGSPLYKEVKKQGADCLCRIDHYGGTFSSIICHAKDNYYHMVEYDGTTSIQYIEIGIIERLNYIRKVKPSIAEDIYCGRYSRYKEQILFTKMNDEISVYVEDITQAYERKFLCRISKDDKVFKYLQNIDFEIVGWKKDKNNNLYLLIYAKQGVSNLASLACNSIDDSITENDSNNIWIRVGITKEKKQYDEVYVSTAYDPLLDYIYDFINCDVDAVLPDHFILKYKKSEYSILIPKNINHQNTKIGDKVKVYLADFDYIQKIAYAYWDKYYVSSQLTKPVFQVNQQLEIEIKKGRDNIYSYKEPYGNLFKIEIKENKISRIMPTDKYHRCRVRVKTVYSAFSYQMQIVWVNE